LMEHPHSLKIRACLHHYTFIVNPFYCCNPDHCEFRGRHSCAGFPRGLDFFQIPGFVL
jgi:hypothetical protein